jgi:mannan endo-1,4-beta-mannosidase
MKTKALYPLLFILVLTLITSCDKDSDSNNESKDTTAPTLTSSNPANGVIDIAPPASITLTYNEDVKLVDNYQIKVNGTNCACSAVGKTITISIALAYETAYEVLVTKNTVKDAAGNFAIAQTITFSTGKETVDGKEPFIGIGTYEAEKAIFSSGLNILTTLTGFSGDGYVGDFRSTTDKLTFNINGLSTKYYDVYIKYSTSTWGAKICKVNINDNETMFNLPATNGAFSEVKFGKIKLSNSNNVIIISPSWTYFTIDYVKVLENTDPVVPIDVSPVMANASSQTVNLYNFLRNNYGIKVISGAMANVAWNINEAEWIKQQTGKYPAMATVDYIHLPYSPSDWIDYTKISFLEDWWNNNGIVSACWHWSVPKYKGASQYTYKPEETTFNPANATVEGTWENDIVKADLATMASCFKLLKDKNIPVIWRPLHEASGNIYEYTGGTAWFWWGYSGAEACKKLWIYMFKYFEDQGINNLIWVWTASTKDHDFYPGDDYVDIISCDIYNVTSGGSIAGQFNAMQGIYPNKMVTLSECGNVANISQQWDAGATWSYYMPWYDFDRTKDMNSTGFNSTQHSSANADWWKAAFNQSYVISRDQMPSLK